MKPFIFFLSIFLTSCSPTVFDDIESNYKAIDVSKFTELSFSELKNLHNNTIGKDTIIVGYLVSSDIQNNISKELYIQNTFNENDLAIDNPRMGVKVKIGIYDYYLKYAPGTKIAINLNGLKKTYTNNVLTLGVQEGVNFNEIHETKLNNHILVQPEHQTIIPKTTTLATLSTNDINTVVQIENIHFDESTHLNPLAGMEGESYEGKRLLTECDTSNKNQILLQTSNYAQFANEIIQNQQYQLKGIYTINYNKEPVIRLNKIAELKNIGDFVPCPPIITPNLMITEVADPNVQTGENARYVEIYNPTSNNINLNNWKLVRYNKTSTNNRLEIPLKGYHIPANGFVVISKNNSNFAQYFLTEPTITSSYLDGNGDDAYELIDPLNVIKDVYGEPNIDGSKLPWDYENGFAKRKTTVLQGNSTFDINEWEVLKNASILPNNQFTPFQR